MTYTEAIDFLFTSLPMFQRVGGAAYKANLDNTHRLDASFGHPHRKFHTIHVSGTNGKGSTSHMLAAILQSAGYKTGLYTSPHLLDFRERIRVNGAMIPEAEVIAFVENHQSVIQEVKPSFFEMTVAMAFDYFARQEVDVAVIEVGMGGRLDSTNIITPLVSVITNISHDHSQFLGDTLEKIAAEKGGIIKPGVPVVIGESQPETAPVFEQIARRKQAPIVFADKAFQTVCVESGLQSQSIVIKNTKTDIQTTYSLDLPGRYQEKNIKTVLQTVEVLNVQKIILLPENSVTSGLSCAAKLTGLSGRWQVLAENPLIVVDTGHNEAGIGEIVRQIECTPHRKLFMVFGVVNDKDLSKIWPLLPRKAHYIFTQSSIDRALDAEILAQKAAEQGFSGELVPHISDAVQRARDLAASDDMIFIGGSTFTVAEALPIFSVE
ncbi:bifunctional folylpolyglutamate synthase/dihydrofolate synthase [Alistipes sp. OttesenSCG-928-L06]|nr:bifunctional folylpolyglutamate synthase/dihydrofolate synthase [Alistipes sp. OttesenSCG-928-L06]